MQVKVRMKQLKEGGVNSTNWRGAADDALAAVPELLQLCEGEVTALEAADAMLLLPVAESLCAEPPESPESEMLPAQLPRAELP